MNETVEKLMQPFPQSAIKQREGAGRKQFDYIEGEGIIERLIQATDGVFDLEVLDGPVLYEGLKASSGRGERPISPFWQAKVRLTIPGLGSRTQVGTAVLENEDSAKGAITDGMKKAATLFGVALQLYETAPGRTSAGKTATAAANTRSVLNNSGAPCPDCRAPHGKPHGNKCTELAKQAA